MTPDPLPDFRELSSEEAMALLVDSHFGRLAFSFRDRVDIEPISIVVQGGWVYGRTSSGAKLATLSHHRWVALEVDDVQGRFDWRSVVLHGALYLLDPVMDEDVHAQALEIIRSVDPLALTAEDATPNRVLLFRIHIDSLTGRAASSDAQP